MSSRGTAPAILAAAVTESRALARELGSTGASAISRHLGSAGRRRSSRLSSRRGLRSRGSGAGAASSKGRVAASAAVGRCRTAPSSAGAAVSKGATLACESVGAAAGSVSGDLLGSSGSRSRGLEEGNR